MERKYINWFRGFIFFVSSHETLFRYLIKLKKKTKNVRSCWGGVFFYYSNKETANDCHVLPVFYTVRNKCFGRGCENQSRKRFKLQALPLCLYRSSFLCKKPFYCTWNNVTMSIGKRKSNQPDEKARQFKFVSKLLKVVGRGSILFGINVLKFHKNNAIFPL